MNLTLHQISILSAAVAHIHRTYEDKEVPTGDLNPYCHSGGFKTLHVIRTGNTRSLSVNNQELMIDLDLPVINPVLPTLPPASSIKIPLFKVA